MINNDGLMKGEHEAFALELSAYIDGELDGEEAERIKAHLDECSECRELYERFIGLSEDLKNVCPAVPDGLHERIMNAVQNEKVKKNRGVLKFSFALRRCGLWIGAGAAAVICLIFIGSPIFKGGFDMKMNGSAEDAMAVRENSIETSCISSYFAANEAVVEIEAADYNKYIYDCVEEQKSMTERTQGIPSECEDGEAKEENVTADVIMEAADDQETAYADIRIEEMIIPSFFLPRGKLD